MKNTRFSENDADDGAKDGDLISGEVGAFIDEDDMPNKIALLGEINEDTSSKVIFSLLSLPEIKPDEEKGNVEFVISTPGGSADDMFAMYDQMRMLRGQYDFSTVGLGKVMSAGVLLLAAGTKGKRKIGKHCRVMIHNASGGYAGEMFNIKNEMDELLGIQKMYISALAAEINLSERQLKKLLGKKINIYLTAQEAVDYGIADEVV